MNERFLPFLLLVSNYLLVALADTTHEDCKFNFEPLFFLIPFRYFSSLLNAISSIIFFHYIFLIHRTQSIGTLEPEAQALDLLVFFFSFRFHLNHAPGYSGKVSQ